MIQKATRRALSLPPAFRGVAAGEGHDAHGAARKLAAQGADPGTFVWTQRQGVADCAVVLAPEEALANSLPAAYVAMLALGDALGTIIPPAVPLAFGWPDRILVNGGAVGGIRLLAAPTDTAESVPDWIVSGFTLRLRAPARRGEPGREPSRTTLEAEGCGDVAAPALLEGFARHFLTWMNRWQEDGFAPVKAAWLARAAGYGAKNAGLELGGPWAERKLLRMDADGGVVFSEDGKETRLPLAGILAGPTWKI